MKRAILRVVAVCLLVLVVPSAAWAKGQTVRITLTCAGLAGPIDLTAPKALSFQFGPWGGAFRDSLRDVGSRVTEGLRLCEVAFYVRYRARDVQLAYVFYYYQGRASAPGHTYLPGRGDPWYSLNTGSILRPGEDGGWCAASLAWEALVRPAIAHAEAAERHAT